MPQTAEQKALYDSYVSGQISREEYIKRAQSYDIQRATQYYKVSSAVLDVTDALGKTKELYTTMQQAAPKTIEESANLEYAFAKEAIKEYEQKEALAQTLAVVPPQGETQPMALSFLGELASAALKAVQSPTGQSIVTGITGAVAPALGLGEGKLYSVKRRNGRLVDQSTGRTIGYTPQAAKKKFKAKRRRKRWTKADERGMQWQAYMTSIAAGKPAVPPPPI